jgi:hypothetical protein
LIDPVPTEAILVGVFGFLNDYKGFRTVIRSLRHLDKNHHLLIFKERTQTKSGPISQFIPTSPRFSATPMSMHRFGIKHVH